MAKKPRFSQKVKPMRIYFMFTDCPMTPQMLKFKQKDI